MNFTMEQKTDIPFPFVPPRVDPRFDKSPILEVFLKNLKRLPQHIKQSFAYMIDDPRIAYMRNQKHYCEHVMLNNGINDMLHLIIQTPQKFQSSAIIVASIISNINPRDIIDLAQLNISQVEADLITQILQHFDISVPAVTFKNNGKVLVNHVRYPIPSTMKWFILAETLLNVPVPTEFNEKNGKKKDENVVSRSLLPKPDIDTIMGISAYHLFYSSDISNGFNRRHGIRNVPCYNDIDNDKPPIIRWMDKMSFPHPEYNEHHGCNGNCNHQCRVDGKHLSLTYCEHGKINIEDLNDHIPIIFECNKNCKCDNTQCQNRALQDHIEWNLIVVRTATDFGWGVRTLDFIPQGCFVCELLGRIITSQQELEVILNNRESNKQSSLFNLDAYHVPVGAMLVVEAREHGNISAFIGLSRYPNLIPISVCDGIALECHRIAFFAARDIYPNEEITFHPNFEFDWSKNISKISSPKRSTWRAPV